MSERPTEAELRKAEVLRRIQETYDRVDADIENGVPPAELKRIKSYGYQSGLRHAMDVVRAVL